MGIHYLLRVVRIARVVKRSADRLKHKPTRLGVADVGEDCNLCRDAGGLAIATLALPDREEKREIEAPTPAFRKVGRGYFYGPNSYQ